MLKADIAPPDHLGEAGRELWIGVQRDFGITDSAGLALLAEACVALDRAGEARKILAKDGLKARDRYGQDRAHPMVDVERRAQSTMMAALRALNLDVTPTRPLPGRR